MNTQGKLKIKITFNRDGGKSESKTTNWDSVTISEANVILKNFVDLNPSLNEHGIEAIYYPDYIVLMLPMI